MKWRFALASVLIASTASAEGIHLDAKRHKLDNGLRVVLLVDHTSPTVAVDVVYDVGARNEERGRSGFAHLFEHMMFQGSANVAKGDHFKLVASHGGTMNGTTSEDRTNYFEMLPSNELALALWLEADRMKSLDISQSNFENQRSVVKEEFRMRIENVAYMPAAVRLQELTYQGYFPYEHPAIGTMRDLDAAQLEWVRKFHDSYYAPNNAVVAIAGDFEEADAMSLVKKYFGDASKHDIPKYAPPALAEQTSARTDIVEDPHAKLPGLLYGWPIPASDAADHYALVLAAMILGDGESARLHRTLVREKAVASSAVSYCDGLRGPDTFEITVKLASGATTSEVGKLVDAAVTDLGKNGPSDDELKKVKTRLKTRVILDLQSNFVKAEQLAQFELFRGDANLVNGDLDRYLAVSKDDVKRVIAKYIVEKRKNLVEVKPGGGDKK